MDTAFHQLDLSLDDCWVLLRSTEVGRLAVSLHGQPFIFPVNFLVVDGSIVFRTDDGAKLDGVYRNRFVAFEVDGADPEGETGWSVVLSGRAAPVVDPDRVAALERRSPSFWDAESMPYLIEIVPSELSGRIVSLSHGVI